MVQITKNLDNRHKKNQMKIMNVLEFKLNYLSKKLVGRIMYTIFEYFLNILKDFLFLLFLII